MILHIAQAHYKCFKLYCSIDCHYEQVGTQIGTCKKL